MDNTMQNSSNGIDNISINQNYHDELSKFNNAKVFRNLENGSLHLIAVREDDSMIDGAFLNSQNLLTNSIIVGQNGIGNTQTLIDGQYTVNFIDENYEINEQPVNHHHTNEIQLQPAIFQMVNTKVVNQSGQSVMFPAHNREVTTGCRRGSSTSLKDLATLTPLSHDINTEDFKQPYQNIALPPLTPIRKLKTPNTRSPKTQIDNRIKIEPLDNGYVTHGQNNCNLQPATLQETNNQVTGELPNIKGDLPHKKRITKKLRKHTQSINEVLLNSNQIENDSSTTKFECQLCNAIVYGQLDFFAHLKEHYEPSNAVANNSDIEEKFTSHALDQVPEVVSNHFENNTGIIYTTQHDPIPIHPMDANVKSKLKENVEIIDVDEEDDVAEFSDADDMFEGIQNVVNKVQDGSDWYDEEEFQATMSFKPGILDDDDLDVIVQKNVSSEREQPKSNNVDGANATIINILDENVDKTVKDKDDDSKSGDKPWAKCLICDKRFKSKNAYQYHETTHSGVRPHQCEDCGKCFSTIGALRIHSRLHTGIRPYKCRFCERPFRQWGDMKYHITSIHTNEKKYQCEFCGKGFARRYSLVVHRRIHTGERNYRCEFCDKTFRASSYLVNHRRIHTGEKPHECTICEKKFRVRSDMKRHMNIHTRPSTRPSKKSQVSNKKTPIEEPRVSVSPKASEPAPIVVPIKKGNIKKETTKNGPVESTDVIYPDQNIDILRKVLLTERPASSTETTDSNDSVKVKQEEPVDF